MAVIQTSKVQMRRGTELELPGVPTSTSPLRFEAGLDIGELGYAVDTGRLFVGHAPNLGQINYKRTQFPYQNVEVLTEASTDTLRRIFGFLERDKGPENYYTGLLQPGNDWQDVYIERTSGAATPFRFAGTDVIATLEYYVTAWYSANNNVHRDPLRQGTLRILTQDGAEEAHVSDDGYSMRRLDLVNPMSQEGDWAYANINFRVLRGGTIGERYHRLQFMSELDYPVRLYFQVGRPTRTAGSPFEAPALANATTVPSTATFTRRDIEDIVGGMVSNNVEDHIAVTYNTTARKLNFQVPQDRGFAPFILHFDGDLFGAKELDGYDQTVQMTLANTGVTPGTYTNATVRVDAQGRVVDIRNGSGGGGGAGTVYTMKNLGNGTPIFLATSPEGTFSLRSLRAGAGISLTSNDNEITVTSSLIVPPALKVTGSAKTTSSVSELIFTGSGVTVADSGNGKVTVNITGGTSTGGGSSTGSSASFKGEWADTSGLQVLTFESGIIPPNFTFERPGASIITAADADVKTTSALTFPTMGDGQTTYVDIPFTMSAGLAAPYAIVRYFLQSEGRFDFLRIYIDGAEVLSDSGVKSGYLEFKSAALSAGSHVLRLQYGKDSSSTGGFDNVRFSKITLPSSGGGTGYAFGDIVTLAGKTYMCLVANTIAQPGVDGTWLNIPAPIANTGVRAGSYTNANITIGADGRVTAASNGVAGSGGGGSGSSQGAAVTTASYWRLRFLSNNGGSTVEVGEVQFRGVPGGPTLTTGGTAFADSQYPGNYGPENAFDGNADNQWSGVSQTPAVNTFIGYQFAEAVNVQEVAITVPAEGPQFAPRAAWLEASSDGIAYREMMSFVCTDWVAAPTQVFTVPAISTVTVVGGGSSSSTPVSAARWDFVPPQATDFPDVASISTAGLLGMTDDADEGLLLSLTPQTGDRTAFALKDLPATGDWTVTMRIRQDNLFLDYGMQGICWVNNTQCGLFGPEVSRAYVSNVYYAKNGGYLNTPVSQKTAKPTEWLRIVYSASSGTYSYQISANGKLFTPIGIQSDSDVGGKLTKIGVGFGCNQAPVVPGYQFTASIPYWSQSF